MVDTIDLTEQTKPQALLVGVKQLIERNAKYKPVFKRFCKMAVQGTLDHTEQERLLEKLSELLLDAETTVDIAGVFPQILLELLHRAIPLDQSLDDGSLVKDVNCQIIGKLLLLHPDVLSFARLYFNKYPSPFENELTAPSVSKKAKIPRKVPRVDLLYCCYNMTRKLGEFVREKWSWSRFLLFIKDANTPLEKWLSLQCLTFIFNTPPDHLHVNDTFKNLNHFQCQTELEQFEQTIHTQHNQTKISGQNTNSNTTHVANVSGILLPIHNPNAIRTHSLVLVDSTRKNLRKLALGIVSNHPVCLQGPVGSGKTTLVEYLAGLTGRELGKTFLKVQLSDQTDAKLLLGTYKCTDVPGEFVWQSGVLTQAIMNGCWLLLEDIDNASNDVVTLLLELFENNSILVPGFQDSVRPAPGFHVFLTRRLLTTALGSYRPNLNTSLIDKKLFTANLQPQTNDELTTIIATLHPSLKTIATRLVDVYFQFAKPHHTNEPHAFHTNTRFISTRDLLKLCTRAQTDIEKPPEQSALLIYQHAIDIFCSSTSNPVSQHINVAARLGIVPQTAEYYYRDYKPVIVTETKKSRVSFKSNRIDLTSTPVQQNVGVKFSFTKPSTCLLERIALAIKHHEPILLVGETGVGKTSSVQYLAHALQQKLIVINMNQQSDSVDLLGGFKPVDVQILVGHVRNDFERLFRDFFDVNANVTYLQNISMCLASGKLVKVLKLMNQSCVAAIARLTGTTSVTENANLKRAWTEVKVKIDKLQQAIRTNNSIAFSFVEGSLVRAIEHGHWVLLDEINLANAETLECLSGLLENKHGSINLIERGDSLPIKRHENFTLFACMNPATDVGKKELPSGMRNRFTEFFVDELTDANDLTLLVDTYLKSLMLKPKKITRIVQFYLRVKQMSETTLNDGTARRPHFSLRTLCRALIVAARNPCRSPARSLYEAFCLSFLTQLDAGSYKIVTKLIDEYVADGQARSVCKQAISRADDGRCYSEFCGYWVVNGDKTPVIPGNYILTDSITSNLKDIVRVVSIAQYPILIQGDTSVGKTSLITYLAQASGNTCVRINNHEHTDLQEYIGTYVATETGKLEFREGVLVEAMRKGHWIILDELNLAPTEVLEALNRVLDDNRELFIAETQQTIRAHPNFILFATQNPAGLYGGRKTLSRAFRNRFVELHFDQIPYDELQIILHQRCQMPPSYSKKMIDVMQCLQMRRRTSAMFAGKHGFITLRDLFRWGERYRLARAGGMRDWDQLIADEGYLVLSAKVRKMEEREEIAEVIHKFINRRVIEADLFNLHAKTSEVTRNILERLRDVNDAIVWTFNMRKMYVIIAKALEYQEPVLLVGATGCGKTTICQVLAEQNGQELFTVNCHMHTESADFLGGLRPVREHTDSKRLFEWMDGPLVQAVTQGGMFLADEISLADDSVLERLNSLLEPERTLLLAEKGMDSNVIVANERFKFVSTMNPGGDYGKKELSPALRNRFTEIWCDSMMIRDDMIMIVERYLRGVEPFDLNALNGTGYGRAIMDFVEYFSSTNVGKRYTVSIRDILTWVNFIKTCHENEIKNIPLIYTDGANLTFLDSIGSNQTANESAETLRKFRAETHAFIKNQLTKANRSNVPEPIAAFEITAKKIGIEPYFIEHGSHNNPNDFVFNAPTTFHNVHRLLRAMQLKKPILLEGSPGVGKTSLVTSLAKTSGHKILRINLSDQTDVSDLFGADLPVEGGTSGQFAWRDGPFLRALKNGYWILLDELNLASQSVLEGLNACLDHRGEIFVPELDKTFHVRVETRLFACQNPLKQGGSRKGLPQSFLNRFTQVYVNALDQSDLIAILTNQFPDVEREFIEKIVNLNACIDRDVNGKRIFGVKGAPFEFNLRDVYRFLNGVECLKHEVVDVVDVERELLDLTGDSTIDVVNNVQKYLKTDETARKIRVKHASSESALPKITHLMFEVIYKNRMRTLADRNALDERFNVTNHAYDNYRNTIHVTNRFVHIGDVRFERKSIPKIDRFTDDSIVVLKHQLPALRSLCLCVKFNWMCVLVGASGSGKSSVVRTLAELTGNELVTLGVNSSMDTTEILGGFEQVDYNRHVAQISSTIYQTLLKIARPLLVEHLHVAVQLFAKWEQYREIKADANDAKQSNHVILSRLTTLIELVNVLTPYDRSLDRVAEQIDRLKRNISDPNDNAFSAGKFEWIDSLLIKCLQNGDWFVIDNVNLCSAAVLDRLNGLLEIDGELSIGERGVDCDGNVYTIKPHPNFRLFLTMDPKNGEISRAMRNRGVEIYLMNKHEEQRESSFDLHDVLSHVGIKCIAHRNILINIHQTIAERVLGEKPSDTILVHFGYLISTQLQRGFPFEQIIRDAVEDIYFTNVTFNVNKRDVLDDVNAIARLEPARNKTVTNTLNVRDLMRFPAYFLARKSRYPLDLICTGNVSLFTSQNYDHAFFKALVCIYMQKYSFTDLEMRAGLLTALNHAEIARVSRVKIDEFTKINVTHVDNPSDTRWLANLNDANAQLNNRAFLIVYFAITRAFNDEIPGVNTRNIDVSVLNVYDYSTLPVSTKKRFSNDAILQNFAEIVQTYDEILVKSLTSNALNLSDSNALVVIRAIQWRVRFLRVGQRVLHRKKHNRYVLSEIVRADVALHFEWFLKHSIIPLVRITYADNLRTWDGLLSIVAKITHTWRGRLYLMDVRKIFRRDLNAPAPAECIERVEFFKQLDAMETRGIRERDAILTRFLDVDEREMFTRLLKDLKELSSGSDALEIETDAIHPVRGYMINVMLMEIVYDLKSLNPQTDNEMPGLSNVQTRKDMTHVKNRIKNFYNVIKNDEIVPFPLAFACQQLAQVFELSEKSLDHAKTAISLFVKYANEYFDVTPTRFPLKYYDKTDGVTCDAHSITAHNLFVFVTKMLVTNEKFTVPTLRNLDTRIVTLRCVNDCLWTNTPTFCSLKSVRNDLLTNDARLSFVNVVRVICECAGINARDCWEFVDVSFISRNMVDEELDALDVGAVPILRWFACQGTATMTHMTTILTRCFRLWIYVERFYLDSGRVKKSRENITFNLKVTALNAYTSLLCTLILSQMPHVDPGIKQRLKSTYATCDKNELETLQTAHKFDNFVNYDERSRWMHALYVEMNDLVRGLAAKIDRISQTGAVRPDDNGRLYINLRNHVRSHIDHTFTSTASIIEQLYAEIDAHERSQTAPNETNTIPKTVQNLATRKGFVALLKRKYDHWFPDLVQPITSTLHELDEAILTLQNHRLGQVRALEATYTRDTLDDILTFMKFPSNALTFDLDTWFNAKPFSFTLLMNVFVETMNTFALVKSQRHAVLTTSFRRIFERFLNAWNEVERERKQRKEEKDALYRTKTYTGNQDNAEKLEAEFQKHYPNYLAKDFNDLHATLDDPTITPETILDDFQHHLFTPANISFIFDIYVQIMSNLAPHADHHLALTLKYTYLSEILDNINMAFTLDTRVNRALTTSLNAFVACAEKLSAGERMQCVTRKIYDFYHDPNVTEVKTCTEILRSLRARVMELLDEFNDHPTLTSIVLIVDRVESFDVTSPLSRFLAGVEMILTKCREWGDVAHVGIALTDHARDLVAIVIDWRKLELTTWRFTLDLTLQRLRDDSKKWLFYLYNVMTDFCHADVHDLIVTLKSFMEDSSWAEFKNRLIVLRACQLHSTGVFSNVLYNTYQFYAQFDALVDARINDTHKLVNKKIGDYLKIVKWNDINYFAVKETVDKSHRTLHKLNKEFELAIKSPVKLILIDAHVTINVDFHVTISQFHGKIVNVRKYPTIHSDFKILNDLEKYAGKSRRIFQRTIARCPFTRACERLSDFNGEILVELNRTCVIDRTQPKPKQRSQAKGILTRKKLALTNLFKNLRDLGLSYRKGLIENARDSSMEWFTSDVIRFAIKSVNSDVFNVCDENLLTNWTACERFYVKCLSDLNLFNRSLTVKDVKRALGAGSIDRVKGYAYNLCALIRKSWIKLAGNAKNLMEMREVLARVNYICTAGDVFIVTHVDDNVEQMVFETLKYLDEFKVYLQLTNERASNLNNVIVDESNVPKIDRARLTDLIALIDSLIVTFNDVHASINFQRDFDETKTSVKFIQATARKLAKTLAPFDTLIDAFQMDPIGGELLEMKRKVVQSYDGFVNVLNEMGVSIDDNSEGIREKVLAKVDGDSPAEYLADVERFVNKLLVTQERLYVKYLAFKKEARQELSDPGCQSNVPNDQGNVPDDPDPAYLKNLLTNDLNDSINYFHSQNLPEDFTKILTNYTRTLTNQTATCHLSNAMPIMYRVTLLYQFFVTYQVTALGLTNQLACLLLEKFTELMTKGFDVPEIAEDDDDGGDGEKGKCSGVGLDSGTGETDISDQIETEDQLEDAKRQEEYDEKEEERDKGKATDGGIEMSEDFDEELEDVPKDDDNSENEDEPEVDQMGKTDNDSNELNEQIWNDDNEDLNSDEEETSDAQGNKGEDDDLGVDNEPNKKGKCGDDEQLGAKMDEDEEENGREKRKERKPDVDDENIDDDQTNPYHNELEEPPEPEDFDMGERKDGKDDDRVGDDDNDEVPEDNPFDIDAMKENAQNDDPDEPKDENNDQPKDDDDKNEENEDNTSDDETNIRLDVDQTPNDESPDQPDQEIAGKNEDETTDEPKNVEERKDDMKTCESDSKTNDDRMEANDGSLNAEESTAETQQTSTQDPQSSINTEENQRVGQAQVDESESGHRGQTKPIKQSTRADDDRSETDSKRKKPSSVNPERTLGEQPEPIVKKFKVADVSEAGDDEKENEDDKNGEEFQHVKSEEDGKEQVLDAATHEQAEKQNMLKEDGKEADDDDVEMHESDEEQTATDVLKSEEVDDATKKERKRRQRKEIADQMDVEDVEDNAGDFVETSIVARGSDTTFHTDFDSLTNLRAGGTALTPEELLEIRKDLDRVLNFSDQTPPDEDARKAWSIFTTLTTALAHDLSEQLRLVLEPTQTSRLRGDYRTGKRLNMRKIIAYIASQFRKDKIWLRRTRPSKRDYNIVIAIDDSQSMAHNNTKELTFQSLALISKALTLLECGRLGAISFGESVDILHKLTDPFTEENGADIVKRLQFTQTKTCVAKLVNFTNEMFEAQCGACSAKLLVVLSDGRGIFSEGENCVLQAVRRAKLLNVFIVFVIVDNPENKDSIYDIQKVSWGTNDDGSPRVDISPYLNHFPFPFYLVMRDIKQMPTVLSDALRQWFELVASD